MRLVLQASGLGMLYLLLGATAALGEVAPAALVAAVLAVAELLVTCSGRGGPAHGQPAAGLPPCGCWPATGCCSCWSSGSAGRRRTWPARAWRPSPPCTWPGPACWPASAPSSPAPSGRWPGATCGCPGSRCRRSGGSRAGPAGRRRSLPRSSTCPWRRDCCWSRPGRPVAGCWPAWASARSSRSPSASPWRPGAGPAGPEPRRRRRRGARRGRGPRAAGRHLLRRSAVEHPRPQRLGAGAGAAGRAGAGGRPPAGAPRPAGQHAAAGRVAAPARGRRGPGRAVDRARDVPHQHHPEQPPDPRPRHHRRVRRAR